MYTITKSYHWYEPKNERYIIKVYSINGVPFSFDDLPEIAQNEITIIEEAFRNKIYTPEILFQTSYYLISEEAHPLLYNLDLVNPECLPAD